MNEGIHTLDLCRKTIGDQVNLGLAIARAGHFNRDTTTEHYRAVTEARWNTIEGVIFAEQARIEARGREELPEQRMRVLLVDALADLEAARQQFEFYRQTHLQKGTPEAGEKAMVNEKHRDRMAERVRAITVALEDIPHG